ncbi:auxin response factor 18-like [Vicia villosa]|uniref:auxin response factor 18-like n=1 Tax=Vicia villosa TaxID=3911 RepID=UPI00273BAE3C|nr:auxin response factor 18-like [Vicia villosa]
MVQIPQVNSNVFYFPQGHAEHAYQPVHFPADFKIPSKIPCRVAAIHYRADPATDEVYAKLRLVPLHISKVSIDDDDVVGNDNMSETKNKYQSHTKTLTQSDANNGGGFSCPKNCAETLFPPLDYSGQLLSQDIFLMDAHGETWRFRHVYSGMPKRHLLTTGWSDFVTDKLLVSGDSLVFVKAENSDLHIGIRRSKKRNDCRFNFPSKRKSGSETGIRLRPPSYGGKVKAEDVIDAVKLGVNMQPFDVVYYPRVGTPEFFVKTSLIRTTLQTRWCSGMRFKMVIETEDSSRILWFYGTIASVQAVDPAWPDSLWRLLQVTWDNPYVLTNMKILNPWQVKILPDMPTFPIDGQLSMPTFPNIQTPNVPIMYLPETSPAGMQGARHDHFSHSKSVPFNRDATTSTTVSNNLTLQKESASENASCLISMSTQPSEKQDHTKPKQIVLFGKTIQIDTGNGNAEKKITSSSSDPLQDLPKRCSGERLECDPESQCKEDTLAGETVEIEDSEFNFKMTRSKKGCNKESKKKKIDGNTDVDPPLWHAIAGRIVQIPQVNSKIFYFPQGHAEHAYQPVNFPADIKIPSRIPCRVAAISYRADPDTDEVYAKLKLVPLNNSEVSSDDDAVGGIDDMSKTKIKYKSYTKTLTHSDATCGCSGGFSCPRYCAETLFPPLDYSGTPPSQNISPTDVHGETWVFKHVYRGAPKRHILVTGWREFVTEKHLVSGDSLVFLRAENGDLHIGIRRSKRGNDYGFNPSSKSKPGNEIGIRLVPSSGELTSSSGEKDDKLQKNDKGNDLRISDKVMGIGKVKAEDVIEAVKLGVNMQPFDVVYYPRVGTPEFFVETSLIRTALQTQWYCGMRFKMAIETEEDLSRIIWFYGTITSFIAADPAWPDSLWRLLQPYFQQPFNHDDATTSTIISNNPALQMASTSENVSYSTQPSETLDHAKSEEFVPFSQTIQIDSGNENAEKRVTNYSSDPLQDLLKVSSGEKLECNPDNQCKKDALAGETVEIEDSVSSSEEEAWQLYLQWNEEE